MKVTTLEGTVENGHIKLPEVIEETHFKQIGRSEVELI
jgi:hypothetical protein